MAGMFSGGDVVVSRDRIKEGIMTGAQSRCGLEGCGANRYSVRWPIAEAEQKLRRDGTVHQFKTTFLCARSLEWDTVSGKWFLM